MNPSWANKTFWFRIGTVASALWLGSIIIASELVDDFKWFPHKYRNDFDFGPAPITGLVGLAMICAVCAGVPWIAEALTKKTSVR